jgi:hypothetical protein
MIIFIAAEHTGHSEKPGRTLFSRVQKVRMPIKKNTTTVSDPGGDNNTGWD